MRLITLLNHCRHFPGFVYEKARLCQESSTIEIQVRPRRGSKPVCSGCHMPAAGYDQLSIRRFEFVPFWGFIVLLLYRMRRVDCRACGVRVEQLPWAIGKHQLTKAYMLFLAHWARKLSWQETAVAFRSNWDKVCQAVEYVVEWGLEHRNLGPIQAIGVDEIQYAKGHKYLTLVYQIEKDCTRLLWIGKDRTIESIEQFFTLAAPFHCPPRWNGAAIRKSCSLGIRLAMAQSVQSAPTQAAPSVQAPYAIQYDGRVTVRPDRTATDVFTQRLKILTPSAIATVGQQQLTFVEGMQTLETVEAFTEKSDGTKVPVGSANIITRDAASGLQAIYMRDLKQRTVIFQDVQVGDDAQKGNKPGFISRTFFIRRCLSAQSAVYVGTGDCRDAERAQFAGQGDRNRPDRQGRRC
jgi:hypothetical protein